MLQDDIRIPPPGYRSAPQRRAAEARRMLWAAGGVGAVLVVGLAAYFVAAGGGAESVPVIQAAAGPVKVRPTDPGGLAVNTQTSALLGGSGAAGDTSLAPAPEAPDPAALAAAAQQEQAPPAAATPASDASAAAAATVAAVPAPPPPAPAQPAAVSVPSVPETPAASDTEKTAMNIPPPSSGAAQVHNLAEEYNPPAARSDDHGHVRVQLAALDSRDAAWHEWDHLTHRMPALFDGRHPIFVEAHVNGHTYWRVRTAGFASVSEATRFCDDVHAQGGACTVASF
jgi:hypothetical protein